MVAGATLEGTVERIVFRNPETHYTVLRVRVSGRGEATVVGALPSLAGGESIRIGGEWETDRRFGDQFRARTCEVLPPSSAEGIRRYLGSGFVQGIGPVLARRLVARFGAGTLQVIAEEPARLREVAGIGEKRAGGIERALAAHRSVAEILSFLQGHGVGAAQALRIHRRYGEEAVRRIRENPYRLATEVQGVGFKTADALAAHLGIAGDSPERATAGVLHVLREAAADGHTCLPFPDLLGRAGRLLETPEERIREAIRSGIETSDLVVEGRPLLPSTSPGGEEDRRVFLRSLHTSELGTALALRRLLEAPPSPPLAGAAAVEQAAAAGGIALSTPQRAAAVLALREPVSVLTGGPGVGKTTLVRLLVEVARRNGIRVLLASPTGRAARRLSEVAGAPASTVHRLLGFDPGSGRFARDNRHPLEADLVVVDETSMLDVVLAYHLLRATRPPTRVLLAGDADQLPSVGPGNVLRDLAASGRVPVSRLDEIFRQRSDSSIVANAHRILRGEMPVFAPKGRGLSDFYFVERADPADVLSTVRRILVERIPKAFRLDPRRDVQVIAPMYRGEVGVDNLNRALRDALNPRGPALEAGGRLFRVGDRVIALRNDYEKEVFNGDTGRVAAVEPERGALVVQFEDRAVPYERADLEDLAPAYAVSVHRAQGSEYPAVVVPLVTSHYLLLRRSVLYTAVTRARRLVVLVGSRRALSLAVRNDAEVRRHSLLAERLRLGAVPPPP
ncbi:MAG TPA: ATP-dependent RecD-like DNA helicase [Planctomycetota bacterium]|jgi:exodeoxyribonuclease V alpha subunit|nr:ATP-dependent RecD-like DNA helicase [Planctomycetota bacterium]